MEELSVFGFADRRDGGAQQLDAGLVQDARLVELDGQVQRRLAAEGREERVGSLAADDLSDRFGGQGLDVGGVGDLGSVMMVAGLEFTRITR